MWRVLPFALPAVAAESAGAMLAWFARAQRTMTLTARLWRQDLVSRYAAHRFNKLPVAESSRYADCATTSPAPNVNAICET